MNDAQPTRLHAADASLDQQILDQPLLGIDDIRQAVDKRLESLYIEAEARAAAIDPLCAELTAELARTSLAGGKRLRPYLTYLAYVGHGGRDVDSLLTVAVAQELYHHAWLLHDDVMDGDRVRHGQANVVGVYYRRLAGTTSARRKTAESIGIIGGDVLIALAARQFFATDLPPRRLNGAFGDLQAVFADLAGGQLLDVMAPLLEASDLTAERLLRICHYKTASYSFEAPLKLGATLAGAAPGQVAATAKFAIPLGIGYQLRDDLLALFGDDTEVGKPGISDLREGKLTILMLDGLTTAAPAERERLRAVLGQADAGPHELQLARRILTACGARDRTSRRISRYETTASQALQDLGLSLPARLALESLLGWLQDRRS